MQFVKRRNRKIHQVVFGVRSTAECRFALGENSDYGEQLALDINFLAQRFFVLEQLFAGVVPQYDDRTAAVVIGIGEPAALVQFQVENVQGSREVAIEDGVLGLA